MSLAFVVVDGVLAFEQAFVVALEGVDGVARFPCGHAQLHAARLAPSSSEDKKVSRIR